MADLPMPLPSHTPTFIDAGSRKLIQYIYQRVTTLYIFHGKSLSILEHLFVFIAYNCVMRLFYAK